MSKPIIIQNTTQDLLRLSPDEIMYIGSPDKVRGRA